MVATAEDIRVSELSVDTGRVALVAIDVQKDFLPGGALGVEKGNEVVPVLNDLYRVVLGKRGLVYASRDFHPADATIHFNRWPPHCVAGTEGARFHDKLLASNGFIVTKGTERDSDSYSAFNGDVSPAAVATTVGTFHSHLMHNQVQTLILGGIATDYCVKETALDALALGYNVVVVSDAIAGVDKDDSYEALRSIENLDGKVRSGWQVIDSLTGGRQ